MNRYSVPPVGYVRYGFTSASASPSSSPSPDHAYAHYAPHHKTPAASPPSRRPSTRHSRKESYSSPQEPGYQSGPVYPSPEYYASLPRYHVSHRGEEPYVSLHARTRRFASSVYNGGGHGDSKRHAHMHSQSQRIVIDTSDEAEDLPTYTYIKPRNSHREKYARADPHFYYNQSSSYDDSSDSLPQRPRPRRSSHSTKPPKAATKPKPTTLPPVATAADAGRAGIPAGYSTKNWDPTEAPILLLGSVFDANSLGKWVYDWTVYHHGPATPISEVAGDLWLLLIKLAGKMKRADECLPRIREGHNNDMVGDFLNSGDRLWGRLAELLKTCEGYMWSAATKGGKKGGVDMGKHTGCVFVDSIFGRDRELETTESLMQGIRLWDMRFDANCEDILTRSSQRSRRS